ncbi:MAG: dihydropteroate synthase family protein [Lachnospiraceae bacterium]|nr:dihydropteroate synthase family protein [Lachnospiraceae bacterium]
MIIGGRTFDFDRHFYIMGILNVTPDSFSDGGKYNDMDQALRHTEQMIDEGADIIDVGGESTRPGHIKITDREEIERVCPIIEKIKERFDVPVSLDTYKSAVAAAGALAGADLINDIWGLKWDYVREKSIYDSEAVNGETCVDINENLSMAEVIAKAGVPCCLMHNRNNNDNPFGYNNFIEDVISDMQESIDIALKAGISKDNIMIDPGIGFAKDLQQNLVMMNHLYALCKLGYPILLGTSRKSMIGLTLDLPVEQREEGTIATSVIGYQAGCRIFRVHDVKANLRALRMTEAILNAG